MNKLKIGKILLALILIGATFALGYIVVKDRIEKREIRLEEERRQYILTTTEELSGPMEGEELDALEEYPNLRRVDLSGSKDYDGILAYGKRHPEVNLTYTVDLGGIVLDNSVTENTFTEGNFSMELLRERLVYLPELKTVRLELVKTPLEEIQLLRADYPDREILYTVRIGENLYAEDLTELDLSDLDSSMVASAAEALPLLTKLEKVSLVDGEGKSHISLEDLTVLEKARPDVSYDYRFELFGQSISAADEKIEYCNVNIGNEGVEELRAVLPYLKNCKEIVLDDCSIDNEVLAKLREDFPNIRIDWRVHIGHLSFLTNVKIIHLTFLLDGRDANQRAKVLQYCDLVEYLDLGHQHLTDISFVSSMPNLKYFIISYNDLSDISPLANCKNLEMLELYFCYDVEDISPLAECENLKLLNVSATKVHDISPVFGLKKLERFYCIMNYGIPEEQQKQIRKELPDCWITFNQEISKAVGWSFDAAGGVRAQWYLDMYKILRYRVEGYFFGDYPEDYVPTESEG